MGTVAFVMFVWFVAPAVAARNPADMVRPILQNFRPPVQLPQLPRRLLPPLPPPLPPLHLPPAPLMHWP